MAGVSFGLFLPVIDYVHSLPMIFESLCYATLFNLSVPAIIIIQIVA